jgi:hypothetical protein
MILEKIKNLFNPTRKFDSELLVMNKRLEKIASQVENQRVTLQILEDRVRDNGTEIVALKAYEDIK